LSPNAGDAASGNASLVEEEEEDGYTPLDPAYLPPGLEDDKVEVRMLKGLLKYCTC